MKFEYDVVTVHDKEVDEKELLSKMGGDGWELCSVLQVHHFRRGDTFTHYYFKRSA